jgi:hypothetical protein
MQWLGKWAWILCWTPIPKRQTGSACIMCMGVWAQLHRHAVYKWVWWVFLAWALLATGQDSSLWGLSCALEDAHTHCVPGTPPAPGMVSKTVPCAQHLPGGQLLLRRTKPQVHSGRCPPSLLLLPPDTNVCGALQSSWAGKFWKVLDINYAIFHNYAQSIHYAISKIPILEMGKLRAKEEKLLVQSKSWSGSSAIIQLTISP